MANPSQTVHPESPIRPDWLGLEEGNAFSITQGRGSNPYRRRVRLNALATELDDDGYYTQRAQDIQTRELLRADLIPDESIRPRLAACDPDVVEALEEYRLNRLLKNVLHREPESPWPRRELELEAELATELDDKRMGGLLALRTRNINLSGTAINVPLHNGFREILVDMERSPPLTWRDICSRAEQIQDFIETHETPPPDQPQQSDNGGADEKREAGRGEGESQSRSGSDSSETQSGGNPRSQQGEGDGRSMRGELSSAQREQLLQSEVFDRIVSGYNPREDIDEQKRRMARFLFEHNPDTVWGKMHIIECDLVMEHPVRYAARKIKPREYGDTFRFPERDVTDERVFGSMRHVRGGTILIDNSGSMGLSHKDIVELIRWAPNAEIAQYEGRMDDGDLKIIAHHGRMAHPNDLVMRHGNNTIDGPALEWLVSRKRPYMWVSDGQVHGASSKSGFFYTNDTLRQHVALLTMRHHIRRPRTVPEAIEMIRFGGFR